MPEGDSRHLSPYRVPYNQVTNRTIVPMFYLLVVVPRSPRHRAPAEWASAVSESESSRRLPSNPESSLRLLDEVEGCQPGWSSAVLGCGTLIPAGQCLLQ